MPQQTDSLDTAYAVETPEDNVRLYRQWATTYEDDFARRMDWVMPRLVAEKFVNLGGRGPVIDVGAGTGLLGLELNQRKVGPIDGIDISPEMLDLAKAKGIYRSLLIADVTQTLAIEDEAYAGCVSSGTFTYGHVGPEAFDELLRILRPGAVVSVSINPGVYESRGFASAFAAYGSRISDLTVERVFGFGPNAEGDHAQDPGFVVSFIRS